MNTTTSLAMIVSTDDTFETCRRSTEYLLQQTALEKLEMVVVCPSAGHLNADIGVLERFGAYRIVEVGRSVSTGQMLAAGIRAATSPYVMYIEEHNFPPPETAEKALEVMAGTDRVALGFGMVPANPGLVAWAHLYAQFGRVAAPVTPGPVSSLGGHHAVYLRNMLLEYGEDLEPLMGNEAVLHEDLRLKGTEMYLLGDVVIPHVQISRFSSFLRHEFMSQRIYGDARAAVLHWTTARRLLYAAGAPLVPLLRVLRAIGHIRRSGRGRALLPQVVPVMLAGMTAGAVGEALGYLVGARESDVSGRFEIELDRYAFVNRSDSREPKVPRG